jgi:ParB family chromosome partitioning protein
MGLELGRLTEQADQAQELRQRLADGTLVVELDPAVLDPSFISDRLAPTGDPAYRQLVDSMRDSGQQIPILARPHPEKDGHYQIAYGHKRWHAAQELGIPIKSIVRALTDDELVIAQGKENSERRNLSFIERAWFAANLNAASFNRETINAALGVQSAEVSRLLAVASAVPVEIIRAVGPAPKAGRPRWMEFAELLQREGAQQIALQTLGEPTFQRLGSNGRFDALIAALRRSSPARQRYDVILNARGEPVIRIERVGQALSVWIAGHLAPSLGAYLVDQLPALVERFDSEGGTIAG